MNNIAPYSFDKMYSVMLVFSHYVVYNFVYHVIRDVAYNVVCVFGSRELQALLLNCCV